jgi:TonB family protein
MSGTYRQFFFISGIISIAALATGCRLEASMDRFGEQLLESIDNTPVPLVEVVNNVLPPPELPCSDDMEVPMRPVSTTPAPYPERLRKKGIEGRATVLLVVDSAGSLINPCITYATDTSFASSLLNTVSAWKVEPCEEDGKPAPCYKFITIDFELH